MTITTLDGVVNALGNNSQRIIVDKSTALSQLGGQFTSLWRSTGQPAQGAIPTAPALCDSSLLGAMGLTNAGAGTANYLAWMFLANSNATQSPEIHDRLVHNGGLLLNVTTAQTITGLALDTLSVPAARIGSADYSDCQWWIEYYTAGGSTASNATINVTYNDGSTGNLNAIAVGGTQAAQRIYALTPLIPTASQGKFIKGINSVTLSASTGIAGNFGFTCTRPRAVMPLVVANKTETFDWAALGLPEIANDMCGMFIVLNSTTSSGTLRGGGKIING
jgi:hypothetical protein